MSINITFIGNCQTLSLCFFFQKLLENKNYTIFWVSYDKEFNKHLDEWADKCKNKITDYDDAINRIKESDIIIYQEIHLEKSGFSNTQKLLEIKKNMCRLIKVPSIYFDYNDYDKSMKEMIFREKLNKSDIKVSKIFIKFKNYRIMLSPLHPKTSLFLEIVKELCYLLDIIFFTKEQYKSFVENVNYMELPTEI